MSNSHDGEILVNCQQLGKRFCRDLKRSLYYGVQDIFNDLAGRLPVGTAKGGEPGARPELRPQEFWAVEDISFDVRRGQCLGLIGRNGAGKTTILKMLSGLIKPDHGQVKLRGRVGGLIALGAGFNPMLTGRENTFVNGAILGLSRGHIRSKMDEIEAFADIGEFMDAPVQSYSSGMSVRLGFAIAAILTKPDILLLDEVLAVGDMGFTMKCLNAVREIAADSAVIFVSHNMQFVSTFCTDVMVIRNGRVHTHSANVGEGIGAYLECFDTPVSVTGSGQAVVESAIIRPKGRPLMADGVDVEIIQGECAELSLSATIESSCLPVTLTLYLFERGLNSVICFPNVPHEWLPAAEPDRHQSQTCIQLGRLELNGGRYSFVAQFQEVKTSKYPARVQGLAPFTLRADKLYWGATVRHLGSDSSHPFHQA